MSYLGYVERLCEAGHLSSFNVYDDFGGGDKVCWCTKPFVFHHSVDVTNGVEYDDGGNPHPSTVGYTFEEDDFDDIWQEDHHGNKYATKLLRYKIPK